MGNQQSVMTENLIKEIQTYYEHYLTIRNEVDLHDELFTMTLNEQGNENLNRAPFFFEVVFNALSDSFSMSLARLFDKSEKAKSMMSLITKTILDKGIMPSEKVLDFPVDCNTLTGSVNL